MKSKKVMCPYCKKKFIGDEYFKHFFSCKVRKAYRKEIWERAFGKSST